MQAAFAEDFFTHPHQGRSDERHDSGFQSIECCIDRRNGSEPHIGDADREHDQCAGQHKQCAGKDATACAMHEPADVDRELLGLRAGQYHAVVERVEKTAVVDPRACFDQLAVHQRDLPGGPAEAQQPDAQPHARGLRESRLGGIGVLHLPQA